MVGPFDKVRFRSIVVVVAILAHPSINGAWADDRSARSDDLGQRVQRLIEQLGADEFSAREKAQAELARIGETGEGRVEAELRGRSNPTEASIALVVDQARGLKR